jgi:diguanylate cyclase (GGDEF)-like protein
MKRIADPVVSIQADDRIRSIVYQLQLISCTIVCLVGGTILAGWIVAPFGRMLPHSFFLMRANTSFLVFLGGLSIFLSLARRSRNAVMMSRILGGLMAGFAFLVLLKDFGYISLRIETIFAPDAASVYPGKVSVEAAIIFILIGLVLTGIRAHKSIPSHLMDAITLLLCLTMLIFLARYFFGLSHLFLLYQDNPFSIQTLICLLLLTGLATSRRTEYGLFSILLDNGSGGMIARLAIPIAVILPFLIAVPKALLVRVRPDEESYSTAVATSLLSVLAVSLVLLLSWRTKRFETMVRELSLRDELTGLHNRRGFFVLAKQAFELAKRPHASFSVLFFDMDNLKQVNDTLGHEAGSALLKEMAELLVQTFRKTDVIGRIGGDEFVVAGKSNDPEMTDAILRIQNRVAQANAIPGRKYLLSFSLGTVASGNDEAVSLEELVARADTIMYEEKRLKRAVPTS